MSYNSLAPCPVSRVTRIPAPAADTDQLSSVSDNPVVVALPTVIFLAVASLPSRMSPVVVVPRVSVCLAVVLMVPVALSARAPAAPALMVAVGVPEFTLIRPNLALVVAEPPISKSTVALLALRAPNVWFQKESLPVAQEPKAGTVPPSRHCEAVPAVTWASTPVALVKSTPPFEVKPESVNPAKVGEEGGSKFLYMSYHS